MDILSQITESMNKEELRFYKLYALRQQDNLDRKDIQLLDELRKNPQNGEARFIKKYYPPDMRNAYYRLKNRLIEELNRSLVLQHGFDEDLLAIHQLLQSVRIFNGKNRFELALYFLKKAEQKALKTENHELLDIIYGEYIKLSHELLTINPERYVQLRKENSANLSKIRELDDVLAIVSYRLKVSQNFGDKQNSLLDLLEQTLNTVSDDAKLLQSSRFRFKMYSLVSQLLLQRQDYVSLEHYLTHTYEQFSRENLFNRNNHETKLQMLTYLVNSLFKNGKTKASIAFAETLHEAMHEFGQLYYQRFEVFYYNALVNNYSTFDIPKAIEILNNLLKNPNLKKVPFYELFIYLNLATSHFDLKNYGLAIRQLNKAVSSTSYSKADSALKFKIAVAELIIRYDMGDFDFWLYRRAQIGKEFQDIIHLEENKKDKELLKILDYAVAEPDGITSKKSRPLIEQFQQHWSENNSEGEIIRYTHWINEKTNK
jgi:hypothetical protein